MTALRQHIGLPRNVTVGLLRLLRFRSRPFPPSPIVLFLRLLAALGEYLEEIDVRLFLVHGEVGSRPRRLIYVESHDVIFVRRQNAAALLRRQRRKSRSLV